MSFIIETKELTKIYDDNQVVNHLSIQVSKGELLGFLGPNGAGKSTTIKMLINILKPDGGTAFINDADITQSPQKIKHLIGFVPQELIFYEDLTAKENLIFFGQMHGISKAELRIQSHKILTTLGLNDRKDKVKNFSGGMKRRLNIGIALIMNPQILFLDEPSAGLDPHIKHLVWNVIREFKRKGRTIVLTTHDMNEAETLCDRVMIIDQGVIIAEGTPEELKEQYSEKNILEIQLKNPISNQFVEKLESYPFIKSVRHNGEKLKVSFGGGMMNFIKIIQEQFNLDLKEIKKIGLRQNTLEDVFLDLTGRRLRE